jgi:hypothetical protein
MKKINILFIFLLSAFFILQTSLRAQTPIYQLPNNGFETWYRETSNAGSIVPTNFNSFYSASTTLLTGMGVSQRCDSSRDVRAGATGTFSLRMYSNEVIGVRANGNVTTGRVKMGSTTALHVDNHNYTALTVNPPKHYQEITGTPDSLRFWVKYLPGAGASSNPPTPASIPNTTDKARIRIYIHGTGECRDAPVYPTGMTEQSYYYGKAVKEFYKENGGWQCYQAPFEYTGNNIQKNDNGNYYVLVSLTTNVIPGGGSGNPDWIWYDDIEFIYSAWLTDIKLNGVTIDEFNLGVLIYGGTTLTGQPPYAFPHEPTDYTWTTQVSDVKSVVATNVPGPTGDADGGYTSILVTAEDNVTIKEYKIYYFSNLSGDNNLSAMSYTLDNGATTIPINVVPTQTNYSVTLSSSEEISIPQIDEASVVLVHPAAEIQRIDQPTSVNNSKGTVVVRAENYKLKSYNVIFTKPVSTNSKLNWIKISGIDIAGFHVDTLTYNYEVSTCVTATTIPVITFEKSSAYAITSYTPATLTNRTAKITVTAENGSITIYEVNFSFTNDNANLLGYRFNTTNANNVFSATNFTHTQSGTFTTVFALALSTTAGQQVCTGSKVEFPLSVVWYPDTNKIKVTAQDGITKQEYGVIVKNTNCYLKVTSGNTAGLKYKFNGQTYTVPVIAGNNSNNNLVNYNITLPIGPNIPAELFDADTQAPVVDTIIYVQPLTRAGIGSATVYAAHDNGANKTYQVTFSETLSNDPTLKNITYDGLNVPGFNPATEFYTLIFPSTTTEVPEINCIPNFQWLPDSNIVFTNAATLSDTTFIKVKAENGDEKIYKIAYEVVPKEKDAYLIDIRYNNMSISDFNPTRYYYIQEVPYSAQTPPYVIPYSSSPTALVLRMEQLTSPPYTQYFVVRSEDLTVEKIYKVDFVRIKNTNAALNNIKINGELLQNFTSEVFEYEYELPYTVLNAPIVTATPAYQYSHIDISEIDTVIGTVTITVTAEDDAFEKIYTIDFTRELSPVTDINTISYTYNAQSYEVTCTGTEMTIMLPIETEGEPLITEIVLADNRASYEIDEQPGETNDFTGTVTVTAENETEETYSIIFERTLSGSILLSGISYFLGTTEYPLEFNPETLTYNVILEFNNSVTPTVGATKDWKGTGITITQPTNPFGQGIITVTSENGENSKTYTITFQRKGDAHLADLYYTLDGINYPIPTFNPTIFNYNITLPYCTTAVPELVYLPEDNRCEIIYINQNTPNGTSSVTLVTWNQDDTKTYTVAFTVAISTEALLLALQVNGVTIPNFNPNTFNYTVDEYVYGTELPIVTGETMYCDATEITTNITSFPGNATIKVTAGNQTSNTYTVSFSIEPGDNTYLLDLFIDGAHWWEFDKNKYFYKIKLEYGTIELLDVEGIPEDPRSVVTYTIDGNIVNIYVTALNGDVALYQVEFIIKGNDNPFAKMIYVDWEPLKDFDKYTPDYIYNLPAGYMGIPGVFAEKEDPNAHGPIYGDVPYKKTVTIISEDESVDMVYTITFIPYNSITSYEDEVKILVYPNPCSSIIHFEVNELGKTAHLIIYSIEGKNIINHILQDGINKVNIEHLQSGFYFYKIITENTMVGTGKFIKN